ncbi:hypothetical protein [Neobacillus sp. CF12]|uniref:hypothetical protein n=1 Tax=Neobacillus sp. CF12 TaxID=3055864 RepID=UPI0025A2EC20|nr:hypothetical protein [Neobacillus sp. CF12]MDM5329916.1 hypothetical protein [Neobacillus sp. CF12]
MGIKKVFSGFRAFKNAVQPYTANSVTQVTFENDSTAPLGFDLVDEYNTGTSTFSPLRDGVYTIQASVAFTPTQPITSVGFNIEVIIVLNNTIVVADDNEIVPATFFGSGAASVSVDTSTILQLNAGDTVSVFFISTLSGTISQLPAATHFEAVRNPSSLVNNISMGSISTDQVLFNQQNIE